MRVAGQRRHGHAVAARLARRQPAAQGLPALRQVLHFGAVGGRFEELQLRRLLVGERQVETVAKRQQAGLVQLLLAVRGHLALAGFAHAVALLGVRQDDRGLAAVRGRGGVGGVDLHQVVAAALEAVDLLVRHALRQLLQFGVLVEEVVAVVASVLGGKGLHLTVHGLAQDAHQRARQVAREQAVPVAAPQQLDDVPAAAGEQTLQLIDDAAVAAHRAVQALQVAVDHPDQVVQPLARGQRQRAGALGFVHLAIAEHAPDLATPAIQQAPVGQKVHEARVVDAADRADAHGSGGKLPEIRHQVRMGIAAQAARAHAGRRQLLTEVQQVLLGQAPLQEGAGVDPRCAVRLEKHQVAPVLARRQPFARAEEVVEADLEQIGRAGIAGDVAAQLAIGLVGAHHHGQGVPADQRTQPLLDRQITRKHRLILRGNGVERRRVQLGLPAQLPRARQPRQLIQHEAGALGALAGDQRLERLAPLLGFPRIGVHRQGRARGKHIGGDRNVHGGHSGCGTASAALAA